MAIVLFGNPFFASRVLPVIKKLNHNKVIFGSLLLTDDLNISGPDWNMFEGTILVSSGQWFTEEGSAFQKTFRNTYGYQPGAAAAYAYDATSLIIQAINRSGPDRDKIIDNFNGINLKGVTGNIEFDNHGNRLGMPGLMIVENGIPVVINSDQ
jgi:branched-chain amino acid transport system substrate-binding protein